MPIDTAPLGQPVELGQVARELKKLWEAAGGAKSRASLVNFAVLCEGDAALQENTRLIADFTREHACRALLLARTDDPAAPPVRSFVNAHCHVARAGARQICCEQITFLLNQSAEHFTANILLANLDSDLPLFLWWQGELRAGTDDQLWTSVDRLIFDSREWRDLREQRERVQKALSRAGSRMTLCDLNWTRTLHLRQAVAQMFDHPENQPLLGKVRRLHLQHAAGSESTALLFAAWVAAQLGWKTATPLPGLAFTNGSGQAFPCQFEVAEGAPVSCFALEAEGGKVSVQRDPSAPFYRAEVQLDGRGVFQHLLPASTDDVSELVDDELTFGGRHRVYSKALAKLGELL